MTRIPDRDYLLPVGTKSCLLVDDDGFGVIQIARIDDQSLWLIGPGVVNGPFQKPRTDPASNVPGQESEIGDFCLLYTSDAADE